jgi:hypothetical protein
VGPIELRSNDGWEVRISEAALSDGAEVGIGLSITDGARVGNREGSDEL